MERLPLNAMQAFEAAARTGSFAAASVELGVTAEAISQPIRQIEARYCKTLFHDRMLPVASSAFAATTAEDATCLGDEAFIHTNLEPDYSDAPSWSHRHQAQGSPRRPSVGRGLTVDRLAMAAEVARRGLGVALLPEHLAAADLASGRLVALGPPAARLPQPYMMVHRPGTRARPAAELIWQHLVSAPKA